MQGKILLDVSVFYFHMFYVNLSFVVLARFASEKKTNKNSGKPDPHSAEVLTSDESVLNHSRGWLKRKLRRR